MTSIFYSNFNFASLLFICLFFSQLVYSNTITFGVSSSFFRDTDQHFLDGINLFISKFNNNELKSPWNLTINGTEYKLALKVLDDNGEEALLRNTTQALLDDPEVNVILGPTWSSECVIASEITEKNNRMILHGGASVNTYINKKLTASIATTTLKYLDPVYPFLRTKGAGTVGILYADREFQRETRNGIEASLRYHNLELKCEASIPFSFDPPTDEQIPQTYEAIMNMTECDPHVWLVLVSREPWIDYILRTLEYEDYFPKAFIISPLWATTDRIDEHLREYVMGVTGYVGRGKWEDEYFGTAHEFADLWNSTYGYSSEISTAPAYGVLSAMAMTQAFNIAQSFKDEDIFRALISLDLNTFAGRFRWEGNHGQIREQAIVQYINGTRVVVGPIVAQETNMIYPAPNWRERVLEENFGSIEEIIILIASLIAILISIIWAIYTLKNRRDERIVASSPLFMLLILLGSILLYSSNFAWFPSVVTKSSCLLRIWLLDIGFTLLFGALFAKSWRIYHIFYDKTLRVIKISNLEVLKIISFFLATQIIILIVMSVAADYEVEEVMDYPFFRHKNYLECKPQRHIAHYILLGIILFSQVALSAYGAFLAWHVRKIPWKRYDESKVIFFSIYNVGIFAAVILIFQFSASTDQMWIFFIRSALIIIGTLITINTLFIHKAKSSLFPQSSMESDTSFSKTLKSTEIMRGRIKNDSSVTQEVERSWEQQFRDMREKYEQTKIKLKHCRERLENVIAQQETSEESEEEGSTSSSKRKSVPISVSTESE